MYTQILNPSVNIFNIDTGEFIGEARFIPTEKSKKAMLDWINYGVPLKSLIMLDFDFQPSENYIPIVPNETYHQRGVFRALLKEGDTGKWIPVEARITYDWRSRSTESGNFLSSVEFDNVKVDSARKAD